MNAIHDSLWHEIRAAFQRRLPVWLPNTAMAVGDVGTFEAGGWLRRTTLTALGVPFSTRQDRAGIDIEYSSNQGAKVAGDSITFSREGAVALWASAARTTSIENVQEVEDGVLRLRRQKDTWQSAWVYVHEVLEGEQVLVVVSGSTDASARIERRAGSRIVHGRNLAASFAAAGPVPVLWRGRFVHDPLFGRSTVCDRGQDPPEEHVDDSPAEVRELEFLEDLAIRRVRREGDR